MCGCFGGVSPWLWWCIPKATCTAHRFHAYSLGRGEGARYKLTGKYAIVSLVVLKENLGLGKTVNPKLFQEEFCLPLKHLETWESGQLRTCYRMKTSQVSFIVVRGGGARAAGVG